MVLLGACSFHKDKSAFTCDLVSFLENDEQMGGLVWAEALGGYTI